MRLDRISADPAIMHGKPCIRGTRIPVSMVLQLLVSGLTPEQICSGEYYPNLMIADVQECLAYANEVVKNEEILFYEDTLTSAHQ